MSVATETVRGERAIKYLIPHMVATNDPRTNQYLAAIADRGYSLRDLAEAAHVSHETIRTRIRHAHEEQARGEIRNLNGLPDLTAIPVKRAKRTLVHLDPLTREILQHWNSQCLKMTRYSDELPRHIFTMLVVELVAAGVPFTAIAEAAGSDPKSLRRRMRRHGFHVAAGGKKHTLIDAPAFVVAPETKYPELPTQAEPVRDPTAQPCRWQDCPSHSGGVCIH